MTPPPRSGPTRCACARVGQAWGPPAVPHTPPSSVLGSVGLVAPCNFLCCSPTLCFTHPPLALQPTGAASCKRGFCQFIYEPIRTVIDAAMNDNKDKLFALLEKLEVLKKLKPEDKELTGKPLMKRVMQSWLPAADALLEMMIWHLPSPASAQKYRVDVLYEGVYRPGVAGAQGCPAADGRLRGQGARGGRRWAPALLPRASCVAVPSLGCSPPHPNAATSLRPPGRCLRHLHPQLRRRRPAHDVRVQDDSRRRQGPLLRLRPRLLRPHRHRP